MDNESAKQVKLDIRPIVKDIMASISHEREREIISRRFGLSGRKETLEQIGELLGITRERVRQLEKAILNKLKAAIKDGKIESVREAEKVIISELTEMGRVARLHDLAANLSNNTAKRRDRCGLALICELAPNLTIIRESDKYYHSIGITEYGDIEKISQQINEIVSTIKMHGEAISADDLHKRLDHNHPKHVHALASASKLLANLNSLWGLDKWPTVNPKNIRDKIFIILSDNRNPMHFSAIAEAIKTSNFKRRNITVQAIHNELIKDARFVLVGRGIYALSSWGYDRGTVADVIADVLKQAGTPLHRDEITKRVLACRQVKEATILLNLQSKAQFKRVAKATYTLK